MARLGLYCFVASSLLALPTSRAGFDRKHRSSTSIAALIVGVDRAPPHSDLRALRYSEADAEAVFGLVTGPRGITDVDRATLLIGANATRERIIRELASLRARAADQVLLFWAGHAVVDSHASTVSMVARNGLLDLENDVLTHVHRPGVGLVFISDACNVGGAVGFRLAEKMPELVLFTATRSDQVSIEDSGLGHGVFTWALLDSFRDEALDVDEDGWVSVDEVFLSTYPRVVRRSFGRQFPSVTGAQSHRWVIGAAESGGAP